jgi:hypothetical protein
MAGQVLLVDVVELHVLQRHVVTHAVEEVVDPAIQRVSGGIGRVRREGDGQLQSEWRKRTR